MLHRLHRLLFLALIAGVATLTASCGHSSGSKGDNGLLIGKGTDNAVTSPPPEPEDDGLIPIAHDDAIRGSRLAYVTIVVFSDYQCPYCSKLEVTFDRLREEYGDDKLRIVFKNNPLPSHDNARLAAEVGQGVLTLVGQEAFWRYHAMAFRRQELIAPETIRAWAISAGADPRSLEAGLERKSWSQKIDSDMALAKRINANGTPASFINGIAVGGAQPFERFKQVVDAELEKAKALAERGVARDKIYTQSVAASFNPDREKEEEERAAAATAAAAAAAAFKVVHKIPVGPGPVRGPATAQVTIIEFSDFQCSYCKRVEETLTRIRREYGDKVRLVWRDMPVGGHQRAEPAAELARAARAQKGDVGFWTVHDLLFDSQPKLDDEDLERIAKEAKLDVAKAMAAVKAKTFKKGIEDDLEAGDDFQASGTPHFFINGHRFSGAQSFEKFKPIIDDEIAKADELLRQGTPQAKLYETLIKDGKMPPEPVKKAIATAPSTAPFRGAASAKVVIQEVGDFQCPFCKRGDATMEELLKAYPGKIKVVWRDKPLPMHHDAPLAAEAAREAYAQKGNEGFAKMHKLLFENQHALKRDDLAGYAKSIGLDMTRFDQALDSHTHKSTIDSDFQVVTDAGVSGTPAFFVGPYFISGAQSYSRFRKLVDLILNPPQPPPPGAVTTTANGLVIKDVAVGTGRAVQSGDKLKVHYVGTLKDGSEFDSSRGHGQPFEFEVGQGHVIKGWDQGLLGMKVGGKRKLTIPPDLAYGDRGAPPKIPPKSTLLFDIELLGIE